MTASRKSTLARPAPRRAALAAQMILTGFLLLLAIAMTAGLALADPGAPEHRAVAPEAMQTGSLLLRDGTTGAYVEAVRLGADYDVTISGPTARVRVTQAFRNTTRGWVEARYVYPMGADGAVDTLKMVVGGRVIVGEIMEKKEARETYETARDQGQAAGLVEQERPNVFTTSVANVGPGQTVLIQIEYQEPVRQTADAFQFRLPLVIGPRYNPDTRADGSSPVPDAARITPPVLDPRTHTPINPTTISVSLQPGFALADVSSAYHRVSITDEGRNGRRIVLQGPVEANRDFELDWRAAPAAAPTASLFSERVAGHDYVLAFVTPPVSAAPPPAQPREVIFVIDNSGSMGGESMDQAKASLIYGLSRLKPGDRFNVVRFDDTLSVLFENGAVQATAANVAHAQGFVRGLEAAGGTEMLPALKAALVDPNAGDSRFVRQIIFLTDGEIGNEQEMMDTLGAHRGRSRAFMVGIGSAPNTYLMTRLSEIGRGTFTHIGSTGEVEERMKELFNKLESPVATDLAVRFSVEADATPAALPDLYRGDPVMVAARVKSLNGTVTLTGMINGRPWRVELNLRDAQPGKGVSKLWARRKVTDAEVARTLGQMSEQDADAAVLKLGLEHHLVTDQTSLVAIDRTPVRPKGAPLKLEELPIALPHGWEFDGLFGPETALERPANAGANDLEAGMDLPQTGTDAEEKIMLGAGLWLLAALVFALQWKRFPPRRAA